MKNIVSTVAFLSELLIYYVTVLFISLVKKNTYHLGYLEFFRIEQIAI